MGYYNIHTHQNAERITANSILNISSDFSVVNHENIYSAGIHPWKLHPATADQEFEELKKCCRKNNVIAVGECGLDKVCGTDFALQIDFFYRHIQLAMEVRKPMIIHCVRAYDETIKVLKDLAVDVPVIFHGFHRNLQLADQLVRCGYFISFGQHLITNESVKKVFVNLPSDKYFLETDDSSRTIMEIYDAAAALRKMDLKLMQQQMTENVIRVFGKTF